MPLSLESRYSLLRLLDTEYLRLNEIHRKTAPRGIPVGGGDWMDTFFRMEGIEGIVFELRDGKTIEDALEEGKLRAAVAVGKWNGQREWQVHRWEKTTDDYLESLIRRLRKQI